MKYDIPGWDHFEINTLILDLNGTLSVGGEVPQGVKEQLVLLQELGFRAVFLLEIPEMMPTSWLQNLVLTGSWLKALRTKET